MFESDEAIDFGDEYTFDFDKFNKTVSNKRRLEPQRSDETPKKTKLFPLPKNVVQRKFPGPAGLLPERRDSSSTIIEDHGAKTHEEIPCSQMSLSLFQSSPWVDMMRDYEYLIERYDINWIKVNAGLNKLPNRKAPFLGAIIKSIECFESKNAIVKIVLKDLSDDIQGTIMHSLYEKYSNNLIPGAVIVLRQCGVLTTCRSNNHYLTIMPKNLVAIYWKNNDELVVINIQDVSCEELMIQKTENKRLNTGSQEENEEWKSVLEGIDMDSFLEDF